MASPLPERVRKLFLLFKRAVEDEKNAQTLYQQALEVCDDEVMRKALKQLYEDERRHERELITFYNQMRATIGDEA
jgi:rubrerythrin